MSKPECTLETKDSDGNLPDKSLIGTFWKHTGNEHTYKILGYAWFADTDQWVIKYTRVNGNGTESSRTLANFFSNRGTVNRFVRVNKPEGYFIPFSELISQYGPGEEELIDEAVLKRPPDRFLLNEKYHFDPKSYIANTNPIVGDVNKPFDAAEFFKTLEKMEQDRKELGVMYEQVFEIAGIKVKIQPNSLAFLKGGAEFIILSEHPKGSPEYEEDKQKVLDAICEHEAVVKE